MKVIPKVIIRFLMYKDL